MNIRFSEMEIGIGSRAVWKLAVWRPDVLASFICWAGDQGCHDIIVSTVDGAPVGAIAFPLERSTMGPPPAAPQAARIVPFVPAREIVRPSRPWHGTYREYTATPEFRRIAERAKKEWGHQCLIGLDHRGPVEMHHRSYRFVPFGEDWRDLIPLCEACHAKYHDRLLRPPRGLFDDALPTAA